jgi:hypothetical protein
MAKYTPSECRKCSAELPKRSPKGGRPTRWCCEGCQRSGEGEMSRLRSLLRKLEAELYNGGAPMRMERITASIEELQARFDHLAGCCRNDHPGYQRGSRVSVIG